MAKENPMLECLARYSRTNLALMIFDNLADLPREIWRISGRFRQRAIFADYSNLQTALDAAKNPDNDAVLYRRIENLSHVNQLILSNEMERITSEQKGKFIFTTCDFNLIDSGILTQVCRIKFRVNVAGVRLSDEPDFIDFEPKQKEVGRYS